MEYFIGCTIEAQGKFMCCYLLIVHEVVVFYKYDCYFHDNVILNDPKIFLRSGYIFSTCYEIFCFLMKLIQRF